MNRADKAALVFMLASVAVLLVVAWVTFQPLEALTASDGPTLPDPSDQEIIERAQAFELDRLDYPETVQWRELWIGYRYDDDTRVIRCVGGTYWANVRTDYGRYEQRLRHLAAQVAYYRGQGWSVSLASSCYRP